MLDAAPEHAAGLRELFYNAFIAPEVTLMCREVLTECPMQAEVLDIGMGTAVNILSTRDIVRSKNLRVTAVGSDAKFVRNADTRVAAVDLQDVVTTKEVGIDAFSKSQNEKYDIIFFSDSFSVLSSPPNTLVRCLQKLRSSVPKVPDGCNIFFTHILESPTLFGRFVAPVMRRFLSAITGSDFGPATAEEDLRATLDRAGVEVVRVKTVISSFLGRRVVVMARPRLAKEYGAGYSPKRT